ncbi:MAG: hypothetical protein MUC85_06885 [Anaerolineales bacterium]|jgi:hypothetical protein|nr:hypothetical protein [Anaerolineales bacterium]
MKEISTKKLRQVIQRLPADAPVENSRVWYKTQKEHWLGWLDEYKGPGAYGRKRVKRDARFAYNHIVCPDMLLYLIRAIPLRKELVEAAEEAYQHGPNLMGKSGAIRKVVSWEQIYQALWENQKPSIIDRLIHRRK